MKKVRMGMIGGGPGSFIGGVHRMAANLDGKIELVAGVFSRSVEKSKATGKELDLDPNRVYTSYTEMFEKENKLPADQRIQFVSIVTQNDQHYPVAMAALENNFHVICDKPLTLTIDEAKDIVATAEKKNLEFALTHNYTAYPMVKQAKFLIENGDLGEVRKVISEYPQGWLATAIDKGDNKQAEWRTNPAKAGKLGCFGDIGSHAENLAEYITGLEITELCADLHTFVDGRRLEDDGSVLVHFNNGARGAILASQVSVGEENALKIRIYGEKGGLEWSQQEPNSLIYHQADKPTQIFRTASIGACEMATFNTRLPAGHVEGYLEAFACLYRNFAEVVAARSNNQIADKKFYDYPTAKDGLRTMLFLETVFKSSISQEKWTKMEE